MFLAIAVDNLENVQMKDEIDRERAEEKAAANKSKNPAATGAPIAVEGEQTAAKDSQPDPNALKAADKPSAPQVALFSLLISSVL